MAVSLTTVAIVVLLTLAVIVDVIAVAGLFALRTTMQRLHLVAQAACVAPALAGVAVTIGTHATPSQGAKGLLIALVMALFSGVLSHETGRAAYARETEPR